MNFTEKELDLAKKYINKELTDVQFNYICFQNHIDKKRIDEVVEYLSYQEPFAMVCKFLIFYMLLHFFLCFLYSFFNAV